MASQDIHNNILQAIALNGQTIATDTTTVGNIIDTQYFEALEFIVQVNARSAGTVTPLIEDGDNSALSDAAPVSDQFLIPSINAEANAAISTANTASRVGYVGKKRYARLSLVSTGTANLYASALAVKGHPHTAPTDQTDLA